MSLQEAVQDIRNYRPPEPPLIANIDSHNVANFGLPKEDQMAIYLLNRESILAGSAGHSERIHKFGDNGTGKVKISPLR